MDVQPLGQLARTHTCGQLTAADAGQTAVLLGWIHRVRDLGGVLFFDLRDRHGLTQIVVRDDALAEEAKRLRPEFVVGVTGRVDLRDKSAVNAKLPTGEIEVDARDIRLLNDAKTPPFPINEDSPVSEDIRLKYRYLDLRKPKLQHNMILRHRAAFEIRRYFDETGFLEIETPILTKSTPEGARDYLVPSRVHPGEFYALPQSPQIFKQILMISGMDRYFQIVKCFRDEDLRADRQPEFTQVDLEISFATENLVFAILEPLMARLMALIGRDAPQPFRRMAYADAIATYGSDKPDLRAGMELRDLSEPFRTSNFSVFRGAIESGGEVRGLVVPSGAKYSRKDLDTLAEEAKQLGAAGLVWARHTESGVPRTPICCCLQPGRMRSRPKCSASCGSASPDARTCWTRTATSSCGSSTFRCSSGSKKRSGGSSCTIRSRRRSRPTPHVLNPTRAASARAPTIWCSMEAKSAGAVSVSTISGCSGSSSNCSACPKKKRSCVSASSSTRSSSVPRRTAASRSGWTESLPFSQASSRFVR